VVFKVPLKTDLVPVLQKMRERAEGDPRVRKEPAVMIEVVDLSEAFAQAAIRVWTAKEDYGPVKTDLMLAAHLWAEDPTRDLPPPRPSKAPDPSPAMPGDTEHHLFRLPRPLRKVGDQVLAVLDPHRKPDQACRRCPAPRADRPGSRRGS
jgi:small conductance mechanosensitive channel